MKLIALLHSQAASGSDTTIRRIAAHLTESGYPVRLLPDPEDTGELAKVAKENDIDALFGTHALFSGRPFLEVGLPYVLILGGTDLNEYALEPEYYALMTEAVEAAAGLVAFNEDFVNRCVSLWPQVAGKVRLIPQGVRTAPSGFSLRTSLGWATDTKIFLLPSGLRPVKDPMFLIDCVRQWHEEDPRIRLVICGVSYDPDFEAMVRRRFGAGPAVRYVGALARADLHAAMLEAAMVLNTSLSECSPNAVLEAMDLGCLVGVRNIPGNTCLVEHGETGLVFDSPADFRLLAQRFLDDELLGRRVGRRGQESVRRTHGLAAERAGYAALFRELHDQLPADVRPGLRERLIHANGVDLCVETFGDSADPAVLLIAGSSASMLAWEAEFCERLAEAAKFVIRYDHRDTGRSVRYEPGEPPYTLRDLAADAVGLLDSLGLASAHVVGISMGGLVAQLVALERPDCVDSLSLLSTSPGSGPDLPPTSLRVRVELDDIEQPDWDDRGEVIEYLLASERVLASRSRDFDAVERRWLAGQVFDRSGAGLPSAANHLYLDHGEPWRARLGEISLPALVIHGAQDPIYPVAHAHALAAALPGAELLLLAETGHELARADWEDVLAALLRHTAETEEGWSTSATAPL